MHADLLNFLEQNVPKEKKKKTTLGVNDAKLAGAVAESLPHIKCQFTGVVPEILRGIRVHFATLAKGLPHHSLAKAQLSLGHSYSRGKVRLFFICHLQVICGAFWTFLEIFDSRNGLFSIH